MLRKISESLRRHKITLFPPSPSLALMWQSSVGWDSAPLNHSGTSRLPPGPGAPLGSSASHQPTATGSVRVMREVFELGLEVVQIAFTHPRKNSSNCPAPHQKDGRCVPGTVLFKQDRTGLSAAAPCFSKWFAATCITINWHGKWLIRMQMSRLKPRPNEAEYLDVGPGTCVFRSCPGRPRLQHPHGEDAKMRKLRRWGVKLDWSERGRLFPSSAFSTFGTFSKRN